MAGSILIVDDVATNRIALKAMLSAARYETCQAASGEETITVAIEQKPELILLDIELPDIDGISVITRLREMAATRYIPIIAITPSDTPEQRLELLQSGANDILSKPFNELVMLARLRSLMREYAIDREFLRRETACNELGFAEAQSDFRPPARIAVIAARPDSALRSKRALARELPGDQIKILSREETLARPGAECAADIFLIEAGLAQRGDGLRLMSELRSRPETSNAAIVICTRADARETQATALDLGANDLAPIDLSCRFAARETALRVTAQLCRKCRLARQRDALDEGLRLAVVDPLTGLHNRRYALTHLARLQEHARNTQRPFAILILDLDRFKSVNDTYGHTAGDEVLIDVSNRLRSNLRSIDLIARLGGEEFLIAIPDTTLAEARSAAERLRRVIDGTPIPLGNRRKIWVSISIGLALGGTTATTAQDLIDRADTALMRAKTTGRNQVMIDAGTAA